MVRTETIEALDETKLKMKRVAMPSNTSSGSTTATENTRRWATKVRCSLSKLSSLRPGQPTTTNQPKQNRRILCPTKTVHIFPKEEKLKLMESLWIDLSADPDSIKSPSWHED
jgi:hypothetical protein